MFLIFLQLIILSCLYFAYAQEESHPSNAIVLLNSINDNDGSGNYHFRYNCSDGQIREETGVLQDADAGEVGEDGSKAWIKVTGFYSYIGTDGKNYTVQYTADKDGYRPKVYVAGEGTGNGHSDKDLLSTNMMGINMMGTNFQFVPSSETSSGSHSSLDTEGANISLLNNSSALIDSVLPPTNLTDFQETNDITEVSNAYLPPAVPPSKIYIPPKMPADFVPPASLINSIMEVKDVPYVLKRLNLENEDSEFVHGNQLF